MWEAFPNDKAKCMDFIWYRTAKYIRYLLFFSYVTIVIQCACCICSCGGTGLPTFGLGGGSKPE